MSKNPVQKSVVKALMTNRGVRRVVMKNAKLALGSAASAVAARGSTASEKPGSPRASSPTPSGKPGEKPGTIDSAAVTSLLTSVAKPVAQRMAASQTGRSVLEALNHISGEALGAPKRSGALNAFAAKLAEAASQAKKAEADKSSANVEGKFTPLKATAPTGSNPITTLKWPPPKPPGGAPPG